MPSALATGATGKQFATPAIPTFFSHSRTLLTRTGIFGREDFFELGRYPKQWPTAHALSQNEKESYPSNIIHNHVNLPSSTPDIAKDLHSKMPDYIFLAACLHQKRK
ncbi:hypothetical protein K432DRAFT_387975 [Lepidopterella palustris CBS 459.81]|uniref:Uncharacterized protein n=1 Tax=Lepidopterella palustris CBS 459.81 TaxID=1314670 RepID=A0A8E2JKW2_9PEZI|nr:hypothetical protein K432DRAFT_387975 [Lepidopterella palustris CBS 459.81]